MTDVMIDARVSVQILWREPPKSEEDRIVREQVQINLSALATTLNQPITDLLSITLRDK